MRIRPNTGRGRSIRTSLIALALVPASAMVLLWFSGSAVLFNQWRQAGHVGQAAKTTYALVPGVAEFQRERQLTVLLLSAHGSRAALDAQRARTDAILADFHEADSVSAGDATAEYEAQLVSVRKRLDTLTAERTDIDGGNSDRHHAYDVYSQTIASVLNLFGTLSTDSGSGATAAEAAHALSFLRATEALAGERAILDSAAASGKLSVQERTTLASAAAVRSSVLSNEVSPYLPPKMRSALQKVMGGTDWAGLDAFEAALPLAATKGSDTVEVPRLTAARKAAPGRVFTAVQNTENEYLGQVTKNNEDRNHDLFMRVMYGSALALVAVAAVAVLSWNITRSLIGRMSSLREATLDLAENRLPELIQRLRAGDKEADADALPELAYGEDELGKVAQAFNSAQRTAVALALEQAAQREGARLVFLNMSRRTQILIHRQLTVIDSMERKEQDPQLLAELYRVDHLATRMRRNAESLTVLSGSTPRRRWREAVALEDLLRSSVSEVEGYSRVVVEPMPPVAVTGPAVGDTIHLMAELIENGVTFSPPHTEVRVRALPVAQGYAIEVEDRGLGLSSQEYEAANELLHHPQEFSITSLGEDPRLGLFTVGHLARRHGITASLQASSYGGSLAVVVLPQSLTQPSAETSPMALDPRADRHLASVGGPAPGGPEGGSIPMRIRKMPVERHSPTATEPPMTPPVPSPGDRVGAGLGSAPHTGARPGGSGRLPQRVRRANLAPQLLERHEEPDRSASREFEERRPEQARSMLAALRDGTRRAREQEEVPAPAWPTAQPDRRPLPTRSSTRNSTS
ncbi:nitrate- and nitrite sensing domain-containing protein [Streptomyces sp. NPDC050535]|uniref:sensor histidine kinase n=1 Tax=Streptomyces sp. NPDC050535 TaxID=3365626 RepID=UPI003787E012